MAALDILKQYDQNQYMTEEAIKAKQKELGVAQDGVWGDKTNAAYEKAQASKSTNPFIGVNLQQGIRPNAATSNFVNSYNSSNPTVQSALDANTTDASAWDGFNNWAGTEGGQAIMDAGTSILKGLLAGGDVQQLSGGSAGSGAIQTLSTLLAPTMSVSANAPQTVATRSYRRPSQRGGFLR